MASAVTVVTGEQSTTVTTAGDQAQNLEIEPFEGSNGSDRFKSDGSLDLTLDALNYNSRVILANVFVLSNTGDQTIHISVTKLDNHEITGEPEENPEAHRVTFFIDENENQVVDSDEQLDGRTVSAGESIPVSAHIDITGFRKGDDSDNGLPGVDEFLDELIITASSAN